MIPALVAPWSRRRKGFAHFEGGTLFLRDAAADVHLIVLQLLRGRPAAARRQLRERLGADAHIRDEVLDGRLDLHLDERCLRRRPAAMPAASAVAARSAAVVPTGAPRRPQNFACRFGDRSRQHCWSRVAEAGTRGHHRNGGGSPGPASTFCPTRRQDRERRRPIAGATAPDRRAAASRAARGSAAPLKQVAFLSGPKGVTTPSRRWGCKLGGGADPSTGAASNLASRAGCPERSAGF